MSATELDRLLAYAALAALGVLGVVALRRWPRLAAAVLVVTFAFVPIWLGVTVIAYWQPASVAAGAVVVALLLRRSRHVWTLPDLVGVALLFVVAVELGFGMIGLTPAFTAVTVYGFAYLAGRLVGRSVDAGWLNGLVAVVFGLAGALAVVEFVTGLNPFTTYLRFGDADLLSVWGTIQTRAGLPRAEGAFGHSLALGSSMAVGVALALSSRFRPAVRLALVAVMAAAAAVTLSRTGMVCCILAVLLSVVCLRHGLGRRLRVILGGGLVVGGAVLLVLLRTVFVESGAEATNSAAYRGRLLDLVTAMSPFGLTSQYSLSSTGTPSYGGFASIDNAALLTGLTYGWVPVLVLLVLLAGAVLRAVQRRAGAATIAVIALVPAFFTVAFITQYALVAWFVVGLAATELETGARRSPRRRPAIPFTVPVRARDAATPVLTAPPSFPRVSGARR